MPALNDKLILTLGDDPEVLNTTAPVDGVTEGATSGSSQAGILVYTDKPYSIWFLSGSTWSLSASYSDYDFLESREFSWGDNTSVYFQTAESSHTIYLYSRVSIGVGTPVTAGESIPVAGGQSTIDSIDVRIAAEEAQRGLGQTSLDTRISTEEVVRSSQVLSLENEISSAIDAPSIESLDSRVSTEEVVREAADVSLSSRISAEEVARSTADSGLQSQITAEVSSRTSADASLAAVDSGLQSQITAEVSSRTSADASLESDISAEVSSRTSADASLAATDASLAAVDSALQSQITAEVSSRTSADASLAAVDASLATVDSGLQSQITAEVSSRASADASLTAVDSGLQSQITAEVSSRTSADASLAAVDASLATVDSGLQSQITAEASSRASADTSLEAVISSDISAEASLRASVDAVLSADLSAEVSSRTSADVSLTAVDSGLQSQIDAIGPSEQFPTWTGSAGGDILPEVDNSYDIGSAASTVRALHVNTVSASYVQITGSANIGPSSEGTPFQVSATRSPFDVKPAFQIDQSSSVDGRFRVLIQEDNDNFSGSYTGYAGNPLGMLHVGKNKLGASNAYPNISVWAIPASLTGGNNEADGIASINLTSLGNYSRINLFSNRAYYPPTSVPLANDELGRINFGAYSNNQWAQPAYIDVIATENWNFSSRNGTKFEFVSTPKGVGWVATGGRSVLFGLDTETGANLVAPPITRLTSSNMEYVNLPGFASYTWHYSESTSELIMTLRSGSSDFKNVYLNLNSTGTSSFAAAGAAAASNDYAVAMGSGSTAAATSSFAMGNNNTVSSSATYGAIVGGSGSSVNEEYAAILGGRNNSILDNGNYAVILGGRDNVVSASVDFAAYAVAMGRGAKATLWGEVAHSAYQQAGISAQYSRFVMSATSVSSTPRELGLDINGARKLVLEDNSLYRFKIMGAARETLNPGASKWWEIIGGISRGSGTGSVAIVGTNVETTGSTVGATTWTLTATADTTNGSLKIEGTGSPGYNLNWSAVVEVSKVTF